VTLGYPVKLKKISLLINNIMNNIITPLTNVDFTACIEELKSHLELRIIAVPSAEAWTDIYYFMVTGAELPITANVLAGLNLSIINVLYLETQGGNEYYQGTTPNSCIVLPLEEIGSTVSAYSAPLNSPRLPDYPNGYHPEDCTLIESHSADEPVFLGCAIENAELVYSFQVPKDKIYKSIVIFFNEDTL
jgi:hypothetical protein